jgi:hypothetical protein
MVCLVVLFICTSACASEQPALTAWQDNDSRQRLKAFVTFVSDKRSNKFVAPADRIAVFDNDGTLWAEQPLTFSFISPSIRLPSLSATMATQPLIQSGAGQRFKNRYRLWWKGPIGVSSNIP